MNQDPKQQIFNALYVGELSILGRFDVPSRLSKGRQVAEINLMVSDISRHAGGATGGELDRLIDAMHQHVRESHRGREWPSIAQFVKGMKQAVADTSGQTNSMQGLGAAMDFDPDIIAAARINSNQPVAENYIWGKGAARLLEAGDVTQGQIQRYRDNLFKAEASYLGEDVANKRLQERNARTNRHQ